MFSRVYFEDYCSTNKIKINRYLLVVIDAEISRVVLYSVCGLDNIFSGIKIIVSVICHAENMFSDISDYFQNCLNILKMTEDTSEKSKGKSKRYHFPYRLESTIIDIDITNHHQVQVRAEHDDVKADEIRRDRRRRKKRE
ncbi:hypothetical protein V1477_008017 [Vespula maculifrons]|uniref:Uncharacterized protein n=1 Tax=Vespula maculifrons TaxID=7453 RepID=A0ABD2CGA3_VESMC